MGGKLLLPQSRTPAVEKGWMWNGDKTTAPAVEKGWIWNGGKLLLPQSRTPAVEKGWIWNGGKTTAPAVPHSRSGKRMNMEWGENCCSRSPALPQWKKDEYEMGVKLLLPHSRTPAVEKGWIWNGGKTTAPAVPHSRSGKRMNMEWGENCCSRSPALPQWKKDEYEMGVKLLLPHSRTPAVEKGWIWNGGKTTAPAVPHSRSGKRMNMEWGENCCSRSPALPQWKKDEYEMGVKLLLPHSRTPAVEKGWIWNGGKTTAPAVPHSRSGKRMNMKWG